MKKWLYLIPPFAGLGLFLVLYAGDMKKKDAREAAHKVEADRQKAEDARKKAEAEAASAQAMAEKAQTKRLDDEKKKKKRDDDAAAKRQDIAEATKEATDMMAAQNRRIQSLERDLADLNAQREKANSDYLAAVKVVESLKEERRKAEFASEDAVAKVQTLLASSPIESLPLGWVEGKGFPPGTFPKVERQSNGPNVDGLPTGKENQKQR